MQYALLSYYIMYSYWNDLPVLSKYLNKRLTYAIREICVLFSAFLNFIRQY